MDRFSSTESGVGGGTSASSLNAAVEDAAMAAHEITDKITDKAAAGVDRLSGTAHRAVDKAVDAASSGANWASDFSAQAGEIHTQVVESASAAIRARPIVAVAGALLVGYLIGRLLD
jgi:hypothetical protein